MKKYRKIIGVDARLYGPLGKGLGRYIEEIVDGVTSVDQDHDFVIFLSAGNFSDFKEKKNIKKVLVKSRWYSLREQIDMPFLIWKNKIDLMHIPHFNVPIFMPTKFIVTIHDLILTKFPSQRASTLSPIIYKLKYTFYKIVISRAVKKAEHIIAVSNFTKKDIVNNFKISSEKVKTIYEGVSKKFVQQNDLDEEVVLKKYNIKTPFLLYVGNAYPHKNLNNLIREFLEYKKENPEYNLVLVGGEDYFYKRIINDIKENNIRGVIFPGFVPDNELVVLYRKAEIYVFPSLYEGFGLPPLEAMSQKCLVLSSNKSCLPEILGESAVYFDPNEKHWLKDSMKIIKKNSFDKEKIIENSKEQVKKYSWERAVKETLELYNRFI